MEQKTILKKRMITAAALGIVIVALLLIGAHQPQRFLEGGMHLTRERSGPRQSPVTLKLHGLGSELVSSGVIDADAFVALYAQQPELQTAAKALLDPKTEIFTVTEENAPVVLNFFWALGLGNANEILKAEMRDTRYGGADRFASTGGWTLSKGNAMDHYGMHAFSALDPKQQALVDEVSRHIYRPCCGNSTHFPDCNHGMAMLGFLELRASQGASESELYAEAVTLNRYWFPSQYAVIDQYLKQQGVSLDMVDPKVVLDAPYSSSAGYQKIALQVKDTGAGNTSCSV